MVTYEASPGGSTDLPYARPVTLVAFALVVAQAVFLATAFMQGIWFTQADGGKVVSDFIDLWAAGRLTLDGHAADAYDFAVIGPVQVAAAGHALHQAYPWFYPPTFLFAAAFVAAFPYLAGYAVWMLTTFAAYVATMRAIVGHRVSILLACAFPAVLVNIVAGQNGFLAAALIAGALGFMQRRPVLAGCFLGLLTYKPQLGFLFPLVLVVGGHWRMFIAASVTATVLAAASWLAFGTAAWMAFFQHLTDASQIHFSSGGDH